MPFQPQEIVITDHAMLRFRQRAYGGGRPEANFQELLAAFRRARVVTKDEYWPWIGPRHAGKAYFHDDQSNLVFVVEPCDDVFRIITCWPADMPPRQDVA